MEIAVLTKILMLAFIGEALTKTLKDIYTSIKNPKGRSDFGVLFLNIVIGIVVAVCFDVDATFVLNDRVDLFGCVLTGLIASRGANFVHDLSSKLRGPT